MKHFFSSIIKTTRLLCAHDDYNATRENDFFTTNFQIVTETVYTRWPGRTTVRLSILAKRRPQSRIACTRTRTRFRGKRRDACCRSAIFSRNLPRHGRRTSPRYGLSERFTSKTTNSCTLFCTRVTKISDDDKAAVVVVTNRGGRNRVFGITRERDE